MSGRKRYRTRWAAWLVIAAAFGCACSAVIVRGGAVEWFFMMLTGGLVLVSGLLPFIAIRNISVSRALPDTDIAAGEQLTIRMTLLRSRRIPMVWFALEDLLNNDCGLEEKNVSLRSVFAPMFAGEMTVHYDLDGLDRGLYSLSSVTVTCGDPFGLTCVRRELPLQSELVVTPARTEEEMLGDASASRYVQSASAEDEHVRTRQALREPGVDGVPINRSGSGPDTRAYRDGDSIRHLDFRAAARGRGLQTKVYASDSYKEWHVAIDQYAAPYRGDNELFDACIGLALGAVTRASDEGNLVTLHTEDWSYMLSSSAGRDRSAGLQELRRRLALLRPSTEQADKIHLDEESVKPFRDNMLKMISADWQNTERWNRLLEEMGSQGVRLELCLLTRNTVLSFAMREQARQLEERGIPVYWMHVAGRNEQRSAAGEGVKAYAMG
ncbi:DUF58 domain-containing protein [Paenibacillus nanensis]|nr:DUF58 domain-containing protein [Paenibacillus nanensis]